MVIRGWNAQPFTSVFIHIINSIVMNRRSIVEGGFVQYAHKQYTKDFLFEHVKSVSMESV